MSKKLFSIISLATLCFSLAVSGLFFSESASGQRIYIDVGEAKVKKSLLALPPFQYFGSKKDKSGIKAGQEIFEVVLNDLTVSSLFNFIKQEAFLEDTAKVGLKPAPQDPNGFSFNKWKTLETEFLIRGGYRMIGDKVSLEAYVYYVPQAKVVLAKTYEGSKSTLRQIAHKFSNDIVKELTGKKGIFETKLVVASTRGATNKNKEIWIMDWDGANAKMITSHKTVSISPDWSPDMKKVAYTAFAYHKNVKTRNADLFIYELLTGKRWLVSYRKGINSGAEFMPDGQHILLTISQHGNADIYKMTLDGKNITPVTKGPAGALNVEPAISPDGTKIAYSSTRGGRPMIYTMNMDGSNIKRRTFAGRYNSTPTWSPDGKKIAFAGFENQHFDIFIMNEDGTDLKRLTSAKKPDGRGASNEDPTFSPDGRHIIFVSNRDVKKQLYIVNIDGTNERRLTYDRHNYSQPKWSPMLNE